MIRFKHPIFDEIEENCKTYKRKDFDEEIQATFELLFQSNKMHQKDNHFGMFSFPCDSAGNVELLSSEGRKNFELACHHAELGDYEIECRPFIRRYFLCECGSGLTPEKEYDARGIYLCQACSKCRARKMRGYRREVLTNPAYDCDESIDADF